MAQTRFASPYGLFALVLLVLAGQSRAQDKAAPQKVTTVEGITEYSLPNGVRFLLFPDPAANNVTFNMTVLVGSRHEGYGEYGMAHLLEHMLFKGSRLLPEPKDVDKALTSRGADYNATTSLDRTNYFETMRGTDDNLKFCIEFEADRLMNSFIRKRDLDKEMTVVRSEFESGENNPYYVLNQRMMSAAFQWHNYGKSTIGNRSDIERVPVDRLQTFYRKYYRPDNILLIVCGKFDEVKAKSWISHYYGNLKNPAEPVPKTYTEEPPQDGERIAVLRRVGKVPMVGVLYHTSAAAQDDNPPLEILSMVLSTPPSGRLFKALVETRKATRVVANNYNQHDPSIMEITAQVGDKSTPEEVRDITISVLENLAEKPITQQEVDRAVKKYLSFREQTLTDSKQTAMELSEWAACGDWRLMFLFRDRVAKVTAADVNRVAAEYFKRSNRTVGMFLPTKDPDRTIVPKTPDILAMVKDYKGGKAVDSGDAFDPTPANIEAHVKRLTLPSGIKVALLPRKTRGQTVVGEFALHFGNEKSLLGLTTPCSFLGPLMMLGTDKHSRQQIQDLQDKYTSNLSVSSDAGDLMVTLQSKRDQLGNVLDLLEEILRRPSFPEKEFDELRRKRRQSLEKGLVEPRDLASDAMRRKVNPYPKDDIRYVPTIQENIQRVDDSKRADVVKIFKEQLGGQHGELVLVGDFDVDSTVKRLEAIFAGWTASVPYRRIDRTASGKIPGSTEDILTPDKENAVYLAAMVFPLKSDAPDYPALLMGNYLLGQNFTSRLISNLREKEGLCYSVGSQFSADALDPRASFVMFGICNPLNIDKVDKGCVAQLKDMTTKGVSEDELTAGKKAFLEGKKVERGDDGQVAGTLLSGLYQGRTFLYQADLDAKIAALTVEDVNRAMAAHLQTGKLVIVRAGDFNKKSAPKK